MGGILGEYTELFLEESEDQIEELNSNLLRLEKDHEDSEIINEIFRAAHSLKSSAAFVGLYNLADLAHKMENLLQNIRDGKLEVNTNLVTLLFECFDLIKSVITSVYEGKKIETPFDDMIAKLENYEKNQSGNSQQNEPAVTQTENSAAVAETEAGIAPQMKQEPAQAEKDYKKLAEAIPVVDLDADDMRELEDEIKSATQKFYDVKIMLKSDTPMKGLRFTLILQSVKDIGIVYKSNPEETELEGGVDQDWMSFIVITDKPESEITKRVEIDMIEFALVEKRVVKLDIAAHKAEPAQSVVKDKPVVESSKAVQKSIKVSSDKLDQLMNNVGELVITNSGFQKIYDDLTATYGEESLITELKFKIDQINRISKDLQSGIMNIRMVPIGTVFSRFSRLVRDLSLETGKKVDLVLRGENTELDKKVIDAIGEPLLHLIRNSVDHGLETPEERSKQGKPETGKIELNAFQGGSDIMVEIRDDGRGLNKQKILGKAIQNGLVTKEESTSLSDSEIFQFIFSAGFSTAEKITDISGRGVGMNVVKKLVDDFKGKILIDSTPNAGSSIILSFPQALAIIPSILTLMEEEVYAFPLTDVSETIRINKDQITTLEGHEIINLRGEVLPIYRLNRIVGLANREDEQAEVPVVIVHYQNRKLGFIVDDLIGKHETVIKSLNNNFRNIKGFTGASIMGDGTIILVLDVPGLVEISAGMRKSSGKVQGKMSRRVFAVTSFEMTEYTEIFKTSNATNEFNDSLFELKLKEKRKKKKDKKDKASEQKKDTPVADIAIEEPVAKKTELVAPDPDAARAPEAEVVAKEEKSEEVVAKVDKPEEVVVKEEKPAETTQAPSERITSLPDKKYTEHTETDNKDLYSHIKEITELDAKDEAEKEQANQIIQGFIEQKKERLAQIHETKRFDEMLSSEEVRKLEPVINAGMMNAGMVLSQLIGKEVELLMPEISIADKDQFVNEIRHGDEFYFGLRVRMTGSLHGNLLMIFSEDNGKQIASKLLNVENTGGDKSLSDDAISVLSEISNIVCSSLMNALSNKTKMEILPSVPELVTGSFAEVLDIVKPEHTKFLSMHTEFNYVGNHLLGLLFFLPDFDELSEVISNIQ